MKNLAFPIHHFRRTNSLSSKTSVNSVNPASLNLPKELWQVPEPPENLYIQGSEKALENLGKIPDQALAVVGTRYPQMRSISLLEKIIKNLGNTVQNNHPNSHLSNQPNNQLVIVSGLARGIDTVAHHAALEAGLPTIAVLGAGLDIPYPLENLGLRDRILQADGLIVSEFPLGTPPRGFHFLRRNRLIAGWSKATWVVEASHRSGSLNTARWAREQNKTCFAVPCFPGDPTYAGNQTLLDRDHAIPLWSTHNLGAVWLDLATIQANPQSGKSSVKKPLPHFKLVQKIQSHTLQQGGVPLTELYDWAVNQRWTSDEFFTLLQAALEEKSVEYLNGSLISR